MKGALTYLRCIAGDALVSSAIRCGGALKDPHQRGLLPDGPDRSALNPSCEATIRDHAGVGGCGGGFDAQTVFAEEISPR